MAAFFTHPSPPSEHMASRPRCELCCAPALAYCHSDQAFLCAACDFAVHSANFIVARHARLLLCLNCADTCAWQPPAGPCLPSPSAPLCARCVGQVAYPELDSKPSPCGSAVREDAAESPSSQCPPCKRPRLELTVPRAVCLSARPDQASSSGAPVGRSSPCGAACLEEGSEADTPSHSSGSGSSGRSRSSSSGSCAAEDSASSAGCPWGSPSFASLKRRRRGCKQEAEEDAVGETQAEARSGRCGAQARDGAGRQAQREGEVGRSGLGAGAAVRVRRVLSTWCHALRLASPSLEALAFHLFARLVASSWPSKVAPDSLRSVLAACLWLGTKLAEQQKSIPNAGLLAAVTRVPKPALMSAEFTLLKALHWRPLQGWQQHRAPGPTTN